jgi:hypothetical protein
VTKRGDQRSDFRQSVDAGCAGHAEDDAQKEPWPAAVCDGQGMRIAALASPAEAPTTASPDRSVSRDNAAVELPLPPIHPSAWQLVEGLERPDVLLTVAGGLGVQGPYDLGAVAPVAGPMGHAGFRPAEAAGRAVRIVAFVPGVADQDELAADVAGRKFGGAAAAIVKRLSG